MVTLPVPTVQNCYDLLDRILPYTEIHDLTEGIYNGNSSIPYEAAQQSQLNYLLDEAGCTRHSFRLLDIGCGNGTLLDTAQKRGAQALGITVSPRQATRCQRAGLDVLCMDYRNLSPIWNGRFDGIIANGSIEHFVQPSDAIAHRADAIYANMFRICHRILNPNAAPGRFVTTVIHINNLSVKPEDLLQHPFTHTRNSPQYHVSLIAWTLGGYYPSPRQLERCAQPFFELTHEVDGTDDYRLTSEEWLRRLNRALYSWKRGPRAWWSMAPFLIRHPRQTALMLASVMSQSWQWQFRGERPPVKLLRQTWQRRS